MSFAFPLLLGIDLGTTNGKVACYDLHGHLIAKASQPLKTFFPQPGFFEQNPEDWIISLEKAIKEVILGVGKNAKEICGISLSNWGPGLVIMGGGKPIAPCPTWQDKRCWDQGQNLIENIGKDWIGLGVPQTGFDARVLWALEKKEKLISKTDYLFDVKGFLTHWLTGFASTDPSSGPGSSDWNKKAFEYIGWPVEKLPSIKKSTDFAGCVKDDLAIRLGLPLKTPVFTGLNDGAAATLGSGVINSGNSIITLATNGVVRIVIPNRPNNNILLNHSLFSWPYIDDLWICGGQTLSGAGSLNWFANITGIRNDAEAFSNLLVEASESPLGSNGIIFLPYLSGRGTPNLDPNLRGGFLHLSLEHERADMTRAVLEGISYAIMEIFDDIESLGYSITSVNLTGGGSQSILWQQILSDMLEKKVSNAGEDATLGCAIVTAVGLGLYPNFLTATQNMVHENSISIPNPTHVRAYKQLKKYFYESRNAITNLHLPITIQNGY